MAKYKLGEGYVKVAPNADGFHRALRKKLEEKRMQYEVDVTIDSKKLKKELEELEKELSALDRTPINLKFNLDDEEVKTKLAAIKSADGDNINLKLNVDDANAKAAISDYDNKKIVSDLYIDVHRYEADEEMRDFHDKWNNTVIDQQIRLSYPTGRGASAIPGLDPQLISKTVGNSFTKAFTEIQWDVINFLPSVWQVMGQQFDVGLRQIYNPYLETTEKVLKGMTKPYRNLKLWFDNVNSVSDGVNKMKKTWEDLGKTINSSVMPKFIKFFGAIDHYRNTRGQALVKGLRDSIGVSSFNTDRIWKNIEERSKKAFNAMKNGGKALSQNLKWQFLLLQRDITNVFTKIKNIFTKMGGSLKHVFLGTIRSFQSVGNGILEAFGGLGHKIIKKFAPVKDKIIGMFHGVIGFFKGLGDKIGNALAPIKDKISKSLQGVKALGRLMGAIGSGLGKEMMWGMKKAIQWAYNSPLFLKLHKAALSKIGQLFGGFGRIALGAFQKVAGAIMQSFVPAVGAAAAGVAALGTQAALGSVLALGGALASAAQGAALLAPGLLTAAGVSFATLKIGLKDVKNAVGAAFTEDSIEDFEKAIEKMHPSVQNIARAMREFKGPIDDLKDSIQTELLAGMDQAASRMVNNLLPTFSEGAKGLAKEWNGAFGQLFDELSSDRAQNGLKDVFAGANDATREMQSVLKNLVAGFGSLASQGAKFLGPIGKSIAESTQKFEDWAESLREIDQATGLSKFDTIMQTAAKNAGYLKDILGGLVGTLGNVLKAGSEGGVALLEGMAGGLQELKRITDEGSAGYTKLLEFMKSATEAAKLIKPIIEPVFTIITTIGSGLANIAAGALPGITKVVESLAAGLQPILKITDEFGKNLGNGLAALAPFIEQLGKALAPVLEGLSAGLGGFLEGLGKALDKIGPALVKVGEAAAPLLETVGKALGDIFVALAPAIESSLGLIQTFAQHLTPLAEKFGDLIVKLVEGLVPALEQNDEIFGKLIETLGDAFLQIMDSLIKIIEALSPYVDDLAKGFAQVLEALIPVIPTLVDVGVALTESLVDILKILLPYLPSLIDLIVVLAQFIGQNLTTQLTILKTVWNALWPVVEFFANVLSTILKPQIDIIVGAIKILWNVVNVAFDGIKLAFETLGSVAKWLGDTIVHIFNKVAEPAIKAFEWAVEKVKDGIKKVWSATASIFAKPMKFVIDVVLNKGFVDSWNWVADKLGFEKVNKISAPNMDYAYANGGVLPGYTPGRDVHHFTSPTAGNLHLSGGESIMRPEWTKAVGGPAAVEAMNKKARTGGVQGVRRMLGEGAAFADGGVVDLDKKIASLFLALKGEHGKPYQYGGTGNPSWDCSGLWSGVVQHLNGGNLRGGRIFNTESVFENFGFSKGLHGRVTIGVMRGGGGPNSHMAGTVDGVNIESAGDHGVQIGGRARGSDHSMFNLHWTLDKFLGKFISGGNGGGGFMSYLLNTFLDFLNSTIFDPIKALIPADPKWVNLTSTGFVDKVVDGLKSWATEQFGSSASGGTPYDGPIHGGVEQWRPLVEKILREKGLPVSQAGNVLYQMQTESGGNPNAINNWDSNARAGTPSKGLMQVIDPTFQAHKDPGFNNIYDPEANIRASINYALKRYGSLPNAYRGVGYDQGGLANGIGVMPKYTIQPERVLDPQQTRAFDAFVYNLMPQMIQGFKDLPKIFTDGFNAVTEAVASPAKYLEEEKKWREAKDKELEGKELSEEEKSRIEEQKRDGSFYYGYRVLNDDGTNPGEYQRSEHEDLVLKTAGHIADSVGLGGAANKIIEKVGVLQSIGSGIQTAIPAWQAALNGDPSGLQHNIAAATNKWQQETISGLKQLIPETIAGVFEMVASTGAARQAPMVGTINTGLTEGQLMNVLDRQAAKQARSGLGTHRTR